MPAVCADRAGALTDHLSAAIAASVEPDDALVDSAPDASNPARDQPASRVQIGMQHLAIRPNLAGQAGEGLGQQIAVERRRRCSHRNLLA
jgi:hypothetical protein